MRHRLVAGVLVVAVPVAAVIALFAHAHPDDHDTDHHQAHGIHAHLGGHGHHDAHPSDGDDHQHGPDLSEREDDHDRAVFVRAFLSATVSSFTIVAAVPAPIELAAPAERPVRRTPQVAHGHDPPALSSLPARAPPRLPVLI